MTLANIVKKIFPLPAPEMRKLWAWVPVPKNLKFIRLEREGDYICYIAGSLTFTIGLILLIALFLDAASSSGLFLNPEIFVDRKLVLLETWVDTMCKVAPLLVILFYLRLRLTIDLRKDQIPFLIAKKTLQGKQRAQWILTSATLLMIMAAIVSMPHLCLVGFLEKHHLENDVFSLFMSQLMVTIVVPLFVSYLISLALLLEKSIRFFPEAQEDLIRW